jgi:hypothetical protein
VIEETHSEWAKLVSGKVKGNFGMYEFIWSSFSSQSEEM